eukprot:3889226-Amphidinium_carterae.1
MWGLLDDTSKDSRANKRRISSSFQEDLGLTMGWGDHRPCLSRCAHRGLAFISPAAVRQAAPQVEQSMLAGATVCTRSNHQPSCQLDLNMLRIG